MLISLVNWFSRCKVIHLSVKSNWLHVISFQLKVRNHLLVAKPIFPWSRIGLMMNFLGMLKRVVELLLSRCEYHCVSSEIVLWDLIGLIKKIVVFFIFFFIIVSWPFRIWINSFYNRVSAFLADCRLIHIWVYNDKRAICFGDSWALYWSHLVLILLLRLLHYLWESTRVHMIQKRSLQLTEIIIEVIHWLERRWLLHRRVLGQTLLACLHTFIRNIKQEICQDSLQMFLAQKPGQWHLLRVFNHRCYSRLNSYRLLQLYRWFFRWAHDQVSLTWVTTVHMLLVVLICVVRLLDWKIVDEIDDVMVLWLFLSVSWI